jgi:hypothetical protein
LHTGFLALAECTAVGAHGTCQRFPQPLRQAQPTRRE